MDRGYGRIEFSWHVLKKILLGRLLGAAAGLFRIQQQLVDFVHLVEIVVVDDVRVLKLRDQGVVKRVVAGGGLFKCLQGQGLDEAVQLGAEVEIHLLTQLLASGGVDGHFCGK